MILATRHTDPLREVAVRDAMHPGVLTAAPDASLSDLAAIMVGRGVHAVVIAGSDAAATSGRQPVVSDLDLVRALLAPDAARRAAGAVAGGSAPVIGAGEMLADAAHRMLQCRATHVLVDEGWGGIPVGVLSSLDIAAVLAGSQMGATRAELPLASRPSLAASGLDACRVDDLMSPGIVVRAPETSLSAIAGTFAVHRIHAVLIWGLGPGGGERERAVWRVLTTMDLLRAAVADWAPDRSAEEVGAAEPVTVGVHETMRAAARRMSGFDVTHLVAVSPSGLPAGILSTLDVIAACAGLAR